MREAAQPCQTSAMPEVRSFVVLVMLALILAFGTVIGFRLHMWGLRYFSWVQRLPADSGAWIGLFAGVAVAAIWALSD